MEVITATSRWKEGSLQATVAMRRLYEAANMFRSNIQGEFLSFFGADSQETCAMTGGRLEEDIAEALSEK